jgi:hypothetical protein
MPASLALLQELGMDAVAGTSARGWKSWPQGRSAPASRWSPRGRRAEIVTIRPRDVSATASKRDGGSFTPSAGDHTLSPHCYTTSDEIRVVPSMRSSADVHRVSLTMTTDLRSIDVDVRAAYAQ